MLVISSIGLSSESYSVIFCPVNEGGESTSAAWWWRKPLLTLSHVFLDPIFLPNPPEFFISRSSLNRNILTLAFGWIFPFSSPIMRVLGIVDFSIKLSSTRPQKAHSSFRLRCFIYQPCFLCYLPFNMIACSKNPKNTRVNFEKGKRLLDVTRA